MLRITDAKEQVKTATLDKDDNPVKVVADCFRLQALTFDLCPEAHMVVTFCRVDPATNQAYGALTQINIKRSNLKTLFAGTGTLQALKKFIKEVEKHFVTVGDFPGATFKSKVAVDPQLPDDLDSLVIPED